MHVAGRTRALTAACACACACAVAVVACGAHPGAHGPRRSGAPAATWATEVPPFRLPANAARLWVDDTRAVVALAPGSFAAIDLATGATTSKVTPDVLGELAAIVRFGDGRMIVMITREDRLRMYQLGPDLGLELLREDADEGWGDASIAVAGSGTIAMSGEDRPLQLYAADGITPGRTLSATGSPDTGWDSLYFADGDRRLLARHQGLMYSFDVATGAATAFESGRWYGGSGGTTGLALVDGMLATCDLTTGVVSSIAALNSDAALSRDGTRAARVDDGAVLIHDTTTKAVVARFTLGPVLSAGAKLAFTPSGKQLVVTTGAIVRVVDLSAGTISPLGSGPYRSPSFLAVTRDHVVAGGDRVRRWPAGGGPAETVGPDDPETTDGAVSPSGALIVAARTLPRRADTALADTELTLWRSTPTAPAPVETARWIRHDSIATVGLDDDGLLLVGAWQNRDGDTPGRNLIDLGRPRGGWKRLIEVHYDGYVDSIDAPTRLAALSRVGTVRVVQLPGLAAASTASIPSCDSSGNVHLDGALHLLATDDDKTVWVWDVSHSEGKRIAAGGFTGRVGEVEFVPGRSELVMDLDDRIGVWDYRAGHATSLPVHGIIGKVALDPDATRVAVGLTNGRIMVFALADVRAGTAETISPGSPDQTCNADPLAPPGDPSTDRGWNDGDGP